MKPSGALTVVLAATLGILSPTTAVRAQQSAAPAGGDAALKPTNHPPLPAEASQLWMAPARTRSVRSAPVTEFTRAVKLEVDGDFARALPILSQDAVQQGTLGHYAEYYKGLAQLRLGRPADARHTFQALAAKPPIGYLVKPQRCAKPRATKRLAIRPPRSKSTSGCQKRKRQRPTKC